ncbi:MAG: DUF2752 domain-containing protein [Phycisphaerales bacterium]|nr:DUF2752 domain-containing protein [Phycisphaerales bacterium]
MTALKFLSLHPEQRRAPWQWPALVAAVWVALVVALAGLNAYAGTETTSCIFRRLTEQPCAMCGGTRATMHLVRGEVTAALQFNPLVTTAWLAAPFAGAWLHRRKQRGRPRLEHRIVMRLWIAAGLLLAANWMYLLIMRPF